MFRYPLSSVNTLSFPEAAAAYCRMGFRVFPAAPGGKEPLIPWKEGATSDPTTAALLWRDNPNANVAVLPNDDVDFLDVDRKKGKDGWASYHKAGGDTSLPMPMEHTPSGGFHLAIPHDPRYRNFVDKGESGGLDMRTTGGYIIAAPSIVNGVQYQWRDGEIAPLPEDLQTNLLAWSTGGHEIESVPVPFYGDFQGIKDTDLSGLPESSRRYLTEGVIDTRASGDGSKQLFWAVKDMFRVGMPAEQVLAILVSSPTVLELIERHTQGRHPDRWLWQYTVLTAQAEVRQERKSLEQRFVAMRSEAQSPSSMVPADIPQTQETLEAHILAHPATTLSELEDQMVMVASLPNLTEFHRTALINAMLPRSGGVAGVTRGSITKRVDDLVKRNRVARISQALQADERHVYIQDQDKVLNTKSLILITPKAYSIQVCRDHEEDITPREVESIFIASRDQETRIPFAHAMTWDCSRPPGLFIDERGNELYNRYRPSSIVPVPGDVSPWLDMVRRIIPSDEEREAFLYWAAWITRRRGQKCQWGPLIGGLPGIGKDSLMRPIMMILGYQWRDGGFGGEPPNCREVTATTLASGYTGYLEDAELLLFTEMEKVGGGARSAEVLPLLKTMMTDPPSQLEINPKYAKPYWIPNQVQVAALTNRRAGIRLDKGDRRWLAIWSQYWLDDPETERKRFAAFQEWLKAGGAGHVYHYLTTLQIDGLPHLSAYSAPISTDWHKEMQIDTDRAGPDLETWLAVKLSNPEGTLFEGDVMLLSDIDHEINLAWQSGEIASKTRPSKVKLGMVLAQLGAVTVRLGRCDSKLYDRARVVILRGGSRRLEEIGRTNLLAHLAREHRRIDIEDLI